ncbi:hypothetical protein [Streptomyces sp. NPDC005407]|uniref:hypothetical protein n=1 Tax=Streptomyces sp. NPDC005407 TaxID=3155340 RepID=UPI0033B05784
MAIRAAEAAATSDLHVKRAPRTCVGMGGRYSGQLLCNRGHSAAPIDLAEATRRPLQSAQRLHDAAAQDLVRDRVGVSPGRGGDFFGLQLDDLGRGAEEEPEVEVPVVGFAPGWAGRYVVGVDVYGRAGITTAAVMPVSSVREFALEAKRRQEKDV